MASMTKCSLKNLIVWGGNGVFHMLKKKESSALHTRASQSQAGDQIHAIIYFSSVWCSISAATKLYIIYTRLQKQNSALKAK